MMNDRPFEQGTHNIAATIAYLYEQWRNAIVAVRRTDGALVGLRRADIGGYTQIDGAVSLTTPQGLIETTLTVTEAVALLTPPRWRGILQPRIGSLGRVIGFEAGVWIDPEDP